MSPRKRNATLFLILTLVVLGALPIDLLLPALPAMAAQFNLPLAHIAGVASLYALGVAAAQPCIGPLASRWGRKPVLVTGLALSGVAAASVVLIDHGWALLALRAVQGFGCGSLVLVHGLLEGRDVRSQRALAVLVLVGALVIAVAPLVGEALQQQFGWQAVFLAYEFLVLFAIGLMIGVLDEEPAQAQGHSSFASYREALRQPGLRGYSLLAALAFACHFAALVCLPVVGTLHYGLGSAQVAQILLAYGVAALASEGIAGWLGQRLSANNQIRVGLGLTAMAAAVLALALREASLLWCLAPLLASTLGTGLVRGAATAQALDFAPNRPAAKALGNTLTFACAGLLSLLTLLAEPDVRVGLLVLFVAVTLVSSLLLAAVTETQAAERDAVNL